MTHATVGARPDDGVTVTISIGDRILSDAPAVHVVIDRRSVTRWRNPVVDRNGGRITGQLADSAVSAEWTATRVAGQDVWELGMTLRNDGETTVGITRMDPLSIVVGDRWRTLGYRSAWGDEFRAVGGRSDHDLVLESRSGRSSNGAVPWLGLDDDRAGIAIAPAWSGNWHIHALAGGAVTAGISPWRFRVDLEPGERVEAPAVMLAVAEDLDAAAIAMQRAVRDALLPRTPWTDLLPVEWNHWWPYEDVEVTEAVITGNAAAASSIGIDVVTVDAGWFGDADARSDWQLQRGDWGLVNTERFPSGLAALGDSVRATGAQIGMWIEPEAVGRDARLRDTSPELLAIAVDGLDPDPSYRWMTVSVDERDPTFIGAVCLGTAAGREHVLESMSGLVEATGARWIKLDFNIDLDAGCTRTDHGHGAGDGLFRHVRGLYDTLDAFRARHPEVLLEACSSGGLRIDLGLARHVHAFFLSDPDYTEHHLQVLWGARRLLPPLGILHWSWSQWRGEYPPAQLDWPTLDPDAFDTMLRAAMLHRMGLSVRLTELRTELLARAASAIAMFRDQFAPLVRHGSLHPLTAAPERGGGGERTPAIQLIGDGPLDGRHIVAVFQLDGGRRPDTITPRGLDPDTTYLVTDLASGRSSRSSGRSLLADGAELTGPMTVTSWVLRIEAWREPAPS